MQVKLSGALHQRFGRGRGGEPPEWFFAVEPEQRIETFTNVGGRIVAGAVFALAESVTGDPFGAEPVPVADILA